MACVMKINLAMYTKPRNRVRNNKGQINIQARYYIQCIKLILDEMALEEFGNKKLDIIYSVRNFTIFIGSATSKKGT